MPTLDELNAALQIAGKRLVEATQAWKTASEAADRARKHERQCYDEVETLMKVIRDLTYGSGGHRESMAWLDDGKPYARYQKMPAIAVHVGGHKGSLRKAAAICRRLCARGPAVAEPSAPVN
jgi:hypothetical protein